MNKFLGLLVVSSSLVLAACGGSSSSSSYTGTKTLTNGNKYTCPSEAAMDSCKDDTSCAKSCTLTHEAVKPVDNTKNSDCKVSGKTVSGKIGETCNVSLSSLNGGKNTELSCLASGAAVLGGGMQAGSGTINFNGYTLTCK